MSLGALPPDIDEPRSYVGSKTKGVSDLLSAVFGHRGITHSLHFLGIISILALIIHFFRIISLIVACFFAFGYLMHLVEDSFSKSDIAWFQPFIKKQYKSGFGKVYYVTGSIAEKIILVISIVVVIIEIMCFDVFKLLL